MPAHLLRLPRARRDRERARRRKGARRKREGRPRKTQRLRIRSVPKRLLRRRGEGRAGVADRGKTYEKITLPVQKKRTDKYPSAFCRLMLSWGSAGRYLRFHADIRRALRWFPHPGKYRRNARAGRAALPPPPSSWE